MPDIVVALQKIVMVIVPLANKPETSSMPGSQPFASWNIFDSALIKNANGHHYWETKAFVDELVRRGETVRLFSHRVAPATEEFPDIRITPVFSLFLYQSVSNDSTWSTTMMTTPRAAQTEIAGLSPAPRGHP